MELLKIGYALVRLALAAAALARAENVYQLYTRCRGRERKKGLRGAIGQGVCLLRSLEHLLWRKALGWGPVLPAERIQSDRPCGCGEEE